MATPVGKRISRARVLAGPVRVWQNGPRHHPEPDDLTRGHRRMIDRLKGAEGGGLGRREALAALAGAACLGGARSWALAAAGDEESKVVESRRFKGHSDWVWSLALSPDGKMLVSGGG